MERFPRPAAVLPEITRLRLTLEPGGLSSGEAALAGMLEREKYATDDWTRAGRVPRPLTPLEPLTLPFPQRGEG